MLTTWLKTRIFHRLQPGERLSVEGDTILLGYVRPLFQRVAGSPAVRSRFFRRYSEGGVHVDMRFLGEPEALEREIRPMIEETLPAFLREHFPPPPEQGEYPPLGERLYHKFWGHEPLHHAYTYDIEIVDDQQFLDEQLTPLQREFEDLCSMACLDAIATFRSHQLRFQWSIVVAGMILRATELPAPVLTRFCDRMKERWMDVFEVDREWEQIFEQRYQQVGARLRRLIFSEPDDKAMVAAFGNSGAELVGRLLRGAVEIISRIPPAERRAVHPVVAEIVGHNLFHMLHNRFNISIQEEIFSAYLLGNILQQHELSSVQA
ncbi:lantibiotic dehydratase C-terminal domain-containing protein [Kallotenue papyrolyticum]|uniref:lantibiotic dehydratase C-terminal domain-containing protein n=1 Tax=Kallotenue papyrolyticum TaxID=1325125 RepID=UPI0004928710|nr:lantibiotic dehydratase C-terminal domain-containing protein [Kallotenue papyrolyticum]